MAGDPDDRRPDASGALPAEAGEEHARRSVEAADAHPPAPEPPNRRAFDLRVFLGNAETQARLRAIVSRRLRGAPEPVVDDVVQAANLAALEAKSPPRAPETAPGWLATVAVRAAINRIRKNVSERRWLDPDADLAELSEGVAAPTTEDPARDAWLLSEWVTRAVGRDERDQETLELIAYKARSGKTYEQVAEDHGTTVAALKSRFHEFKKRYSSRRPQRQMLMIAVFGGAVAAVVIVAYVVARLLRPSPAPAAPAPAPVPSASAAPEPSFEPAAPPPRLPDKPRRP